MRNYFTFEEISPNQVAETRKSIVKVVFDVRYLPLCIDSGTVGSL